jgi:hypothetical protein
MNNTIKHAYPDDNHQRVGRRMTKYTITNETPHLPYVCPLCEIGHRRLGKLHISSQSKGMIPTMPCKAVIAVDLGQTTESNRLPWIVYVNGRRLATVRRIARFSSRLRAEMAGWSALIASGEWPGV